MLKACVLSLIVHAALASAGVWLGSASSGASAAPFQDLAVMSFRFSEEAEAAAPAVAAPPADPEKAPLEIPAPPVQVTAVEEPSPKPPKAGPERPAEPPGDPSTTEPQRRSDNVPPPYPESARRQGAEGRVVLRVRVSAAGAPLDVLVESGSGFAVLDKTARQAVLGWGFDPAQRAGRPVESETRVTIRFRLTGGR